MSMAENTGVKEYLSLQVMTGGAWGTLERVEYLTCTPDTRAKALKRLQTAKAGWHNFWKYRDAAFRIVDTADTKAAAPADTATTTLDLYRAWIAADAEMTAELVRLFGDDACNRRYDRKKRGWSPKARELADKFHAAGHKWRVACGYVSEAAA